jgi:hypothetical protein
MAARDRGEKGAHLVRFSASRRRGHGAETNDSDILEVSSSDEAVDGMRLDEGDLMARSARSRWSRARAIVRWSFARNQRGLVVDEYFDLGRTVRNQHVREVRQRRGGRIEPEGGRGIPWLGRNQ